MSDVKYLKLVDLIPKGQSWAITRRKRGIKKTVVGCEVFTGNGYELVEMKSLANATPDSDKRMKTRIEDVYYILDTQALILNKQEIKDRFWDMFVIDAFIGNPD